MLFSLFSLFCLFQDTVFKVSAKSVAGPAGWSGYFNGETYITIPYSCQHDVVNYYRPCDSIPSSILTKFTLSAWIYPQFDSTFTNNVSLFHIGSPNNTQTNLAFSFIFFIDSGIINEYQVKITNDSSQWIYKTSITSITGLLTNQTWNHIGITFKHDNGIDFYLNGNLHDSFTFASSYTLFNTTADFIIGGISANERFIGRLDEIYLYSINFDNNSMYSLAFNVFNSNYNNLLVYFDFNFNNNNWNNNTRILDISHNNNYGTIHNTSNSNSDNFYKISNAYLKNNIKYTINEDFTIIIKLYGYATDDSFSTSKLNASITKLPASTLGTLYQIDSTNLDKSYSSGAGFSHNGEAITVANTMITDENNRVLFEPNKDRHQLSNQEYYASFDYTMIENDGNQSVNNFTIFINVTSVYDPIQLVNPTISTQSANNSHEVFIHGFEITAIDPSNTNVTLTVSSEIGLICLAGGDTGLTYLSNSTNNVTVKGSVTNVNNAISVLRQIRGAYTTENDIVTLSVTGIGRNYYGGELTTYKVR